MNCYIARRHEGRPPKGGNLHYEVFEHQKPGLRLNTYTPRQPTPPQLADINYLL